MANLKKAIDKTLAYFVIIFFGAIITFASTDEKYYDSFIYNSDITKALFFIDAIKPVRQTASYGHHLDGCIVEIASPIQGLA